MKTNLNAKSLSVHFLYIFMLCSFPVQSETANNSAPTFETATSIEFSVAAKVKKPGLFKKIRMIRALKKGLKQSMEEGETSSPMAKAALILFISGFGLSLLTFTILASALLPVITLLASLSFLASLILSFIVLFSHDNAKSKGIAKTILIISGTLVVVFLVLLIAIIATLG